MNRASTLIASLTLVACLDSDGGDTPATTATSAADTSVSEADTNVAETVEPEPDVVVELPHFSFFVTSWAALQDLSGSDKGFGGDLRYGEEGMGAGLRGADLICAIIAERSMPGAGAKPWRAFLSAVEGEDGQPVNAIDRVGEGPWYDRLGRTLSLTKADLLATRPATADAAIENDLPNEDGVPNHRPDPTKPNIDNHHMLTGSDTGGRLYADDATCDSWTSDGGSDRPRVGLAWPRGGGGGGANGSQWMSAMNESGCAAGANLVDNGPGNPDGTVGSGGGYGGFYCFSLVP